MPNGDEGTLVETPIETAGIFEGPAGIDYDYVMANAPSVGSYDMGAGINWGDIGSSFASLFEETPGEGVGYAGGAAVPGYASEMGQGSAAAGSTGGGFLAGVGKFLKSVFGSGGGGGTIQPSPASTYLKQTPATTASTVAATIKTNWLPFLALGAIFLIGIVLVFRRKR
jgi:hypothetical protein